MKNLYEAEQVKEVKTRVASLRPESERQWGKMTAAQALAHCSIGLESAIGDRQIPRVLIGHLLGWLVKPMALKNDKPFQKNSPTAPELVVSDARDLEREKTRIIGLIDRFAGAGPAGCTRYPHAFFGELEPQEWAILMYKHLDHHLRQFGV